MSHITATMKLERFEVRDIRPSSQFHQRRLLRSQLTRLFKQAGSDTRAEAVNCARVNLSETVFVHAGKGEKHTIDIFTTDSELPFAGHPTIGAACWFLYLSRDEGDKRSRQDPDQ